MIRYATYAKLGSHNLVIVGNNGEELPIVSGSYAELVYYFDECSAVEVDDLLSQKWVQLVENIRLVEHLALETDLVVVSNAIS